MPVSTDKRKEGAEQLQKIAMQISIENPCATRSEIAEMVKQELSERAEQQPKKACPNGN